MPKSATEAELQIEVQYADEDEPPPRGEVRRMLRAAFACAAQVTVRFVGLEEGRSLNERYRGRTEPTNVLAFGYGEDAQGRVRGDIVLCCPVVRREAGDFGIPLSDHYAHLIVHGALHLQGFGHDTPPAAAEMERREARILADVGIPSPWEGEK